MKMKLILSLYLIMAAGLCAPEGLAAVVVNEFLADPALGLAGDANRDGVRHSSQDEFVELLNTGSGTEDLSLWSLWDNNSLRHQFSGGTFLPSLERIVIFGGGNPVGIPSLVAIASSGTLSLNNSGDQIILKDELGITIEQIGFSNEADQDQSLVRFQEGSGSFHLHREVSAANLSFSPGTDVNGNKITRIPSTPEPSGGILFSIALLSLSFFKRKKI